MTYKIISTIEDIKDENTVSLVQIVETTNEHVAVDFEKERFTRVTRWRFESGYTVLEDGSKVELTRIQMSCSKDHAHGVYYQAPRQMEIWEAFFAIGEINPGLVPEPEKGEK